MNLKLTERQKAAYDRVVEHILNELGSYRLIAVQIYMKSERDVAGETVRSWFLKRTIPVEIIFTLYEICEESFDPLVLAPWLKKFVQLKDGGGQ